LMIDDRGMLYTGHTMQDARYRMQDVRCWDGWMEFLVICGNLRNLRMVLRENSFFNP